MGGKRKGEREGREGRGNAEGKGGKKVGTHTFWMKVTPLQF